MFNELLTAHLSSPKSPLKKSRYPIEKQEKKGPIFNFPFRKKIKFSMKTTISSKDKKNMKSFFPSSSKHISPMRRKPCTSSPIEEENLKLSNEKQLPQLFQQSTTNRKIFLFQREKSIPFFKLLGS